MSARYLLPALALVCLSFTVVQVQRAEQRPLRASQPVEPARSPYDKTIAGAGIVEPETENIAIGTNLPGIVKTVHVKVDNRVEAGDVLFELDDRQLRAEWAVRAANLATARAQEVKLRAMPRPEELPALEARLREAEANLEGKTKLYALAKRTGDAGSASQDEVIAKEMAMKVAKAQVETARAELHLVKAGAWEADRIISAAAVKQAEVQLEQTRTELDRLKVTAPRVGRPGVAAARRVPDDLVEFKVLQVNIRPGESVATAPGQALVVLGHVGRLHVRVDIDESDIPRFRPGAPGEASPRGSPGQKFPLKFVRVEPFVLPKRSLTGAPTERVDTRVLQVIYAVDAPAPPLYVGQQLDVSLRGGE